MFFCSLPSVSAPRAPLGSIAGRLGGDEFVIFWPDAIAQAAEALARGPCAGFQ